MMKEIAMGINLYGHGGLSLHFETWSACRHLAQSFGWIPGPQLESNLPELYDYQVGDEDARSLALALYRAVREFENGLEPTPELTKSLLDAGSLGQIRSLADYALVGGFGVG
jgi:hypothetical protein